MPTYVPTYLHTYLPTYLHTYIHDFHLGISNFPFFSTSSSLCIYPGFVLELRSNIEIIPSGIQTWLAGQCSMNRWSSHWNHLQQNHVRPPFTSRIGHDFPTNPGDPKLFKVAYPMYNHVYIMYTWVNSCYAYVQSKTFLPRTIEKLPPDTSKDILGGEKVVWRHPGWWFNWIALMINE